MLIIFVLLIFKVFVAVEQLTGGKRVDLTPLAS